MPNKYTFNCPICAGAMDEHEKTHGKIVVTQKEDGEEYDSIKEFRCRYGHIIYISYRHVM